jgi:hypothetical protein
MDFDSLEGNTIYQEAAKIEEEFKEFNNTYTEINLAAEMVNVVFQQLKDELVSVEKPKWLWVSGLMVFGSYHSWLSAYIMMCAGYDSIGLMSLRRAIEFICYLSKIHESDERAEIWLSKWNDPEKERKFSLIFSIPQKYFTAKYEHLKELLVLHYLASDFGAHGNHAALISNYKLARDTGETSFTLLSNRKDRYSPVGEVLLTGYRILQSIEKLLKDNIEDYDKFSSLLKELAEMIRKARIGTAEIAYQGNIPREILDAIISDDRSGLDPYFEELKEKYSKKRMKLDF